MNFEDYLKKKEKLSPTGLNNGSDEETGNYYCPVDENLKPIREKRKFINEGELIPDGWVQCD
ncbi:hypothetical protein [Legionella longbeachae]|uniref:hypothetical protein n=1 Tax=Legionella longbeachae TaxID=450 RepID=UPI00399C8FC7